MAYKFRSIFATEMNGYLELLHASGKYTAKIKSSLKSLDSHLVAHNLTDRNLSSDLISGWLLEKSVKNITKAGILSDIKGFARYLLSLGTEWKLPEFPIIEDDYIPYIFSNEEISRIISAADNLGYGTFKRPQRATRVFPVLLRILYSCGLRLGEGLGLKWEDIDLVNGIIYIREAKNMKQRIIPIHRTLIEQLKQYKRKIEREGVCVHYLFESNYAPHKPFKNNSFYDWFIKILKAAGICYYKRDRLERGPCPHCLRHTFVLHSFLKSEKEGIKYENASAFLAAYLGHDSPKETDKYLKASHTLYTASHERMNNYIGNIFPKIDFDEE